MTLTHKSTGDPHAASHNEERDAINAIDLILPGKIDKPSVPQVGDMLRYDGSAWVSSATRLFEGVGQPEGIVAAPIGSRYIDLTAAKGAVEWLKVRGINANDNTGWLMLAGDTGWRNISSMINERSTGVVNAAYLRRVNDLVDLYIDMKMPNNTATPYEILTLPTGFRPTFTRQGALQDNNEAAATATSVTSAGLVNLYNPVAAKTDRWNGLWTTTNVWPSSLPGTAV